MTDRRERTQRVPRRPVNRDEFNANEIRRERTDDTNTENTQIENSSDSTRPSRRSPPRIRRDARENVEQTLESTDTTTELNSSIEKSSRSDRRVTAKSDLSGRSGGRVRERRAMTERTPRTRTTDDTEGSTGRSRRIDRRGDGTAERTRLSRDSNSRSAPTIRSENGRRESEFSTASDFIKTAASLKINSLFGDIEGSETATSYTNDSNTPDLTDPLTLKKLVSQAIIDAEGFSIVTPERYIDQKKRLSQIQSTLLSLQNKLNLEVKVKEASESIIRLGAGDRQEIVEARMKLKASDEKMNEISKDLWVVMGDLIDAERGILKHIAGVLRCKANDINRNSEPSDEKLLELQRNLTSAESNVKELDAQVKILKSTISRLEADEGKDKRVGNQPSSLEFNRIKLDYATCRAELTDVKEELAATKEYQKKLKAQTEDDQTLIQSKDRMIANLLSELEEANNKIAVSKAGGRINGEPSSPSPRSSRRNAGDSDTDQEDTIQSPRSTGRGSPRTRRGTASRATPVNADLEAKIKDLEAQLRNRDQSSGSPLDMRQSEKLADIQEQVEAHLESRHEAFTVSRISEQITKLIAKSENSQKKLKESQREQAILEDTVATLEAKIKRNQANLESDNAASIKELKSLEADYEEISRKLAESDKKAARLPELQSIIDEQAEKIKKFKDAREEDLKFHQDELDTLRASLKGEYNKLKEKYDTDMERIKGDHERSLSHFKEQINREKQDSSKKTEREIENQRALWLEDAQKNLDQKLKALEDSHASQMEEVTALAELEKSRFKSTFQKEQIESQTRLEAAEQALVDAKQQYFIEKEKIQEQIDDLEGEILMLNDQKKQAENDWKSKQLDLENIIEDLQDAEDELRKQISDCKRALEIKSRELAEVQDINELEMKRIKQDQDGKMAELEGKLSDYQALQKSVENIKSDYEAKLNAKDKEMNGIIADAEQAKRKAFDDLERAQDALGDATDQLERVQRLLKDSSGDVDRYRRLADSRDEEVIAIKRQLRQKEKEITDGALSGASDSSTVRKLMEQKDKEMDGLRSELRSVQGELASLQRKLEIKDREIEEAKAQMRRTTRASSDKDEQSEELNRLQLMLLDLKTTRVDLLEQLDDAQHEAEMLRVEVKNLKANQS